MVKSATAFFKGTSLIIAVPIGLRAPFNKSITTVPSSIASNIGLLPLTFSFIDIFLGQFTFLNLQSINSIRLDCFITSGAAKNATPTPCATSFIVSINFSPLLFIFGSDSSTAPTDGGADSTFSSSPSEPPYIIIDFVSILIIKLYFKT